MLSFNKIEELHDSFKNGEISEFPDTISISGIIFKKAKGTSLPMDMMLDRKLKGLLVYSLTKDEKNLEAYNKLHSTVDESIIQNRVVFVWQFFGSVMKPIGVKFMSSARSEPMVGTGVVKEASISNDRLISTHVPIILSGFNDGKQLDAKVDTGAHICSLHAENIQHKPGTNMVSFVFGDRKYTMPAMETQAVQTADSGIENRPIVAFDVVLLNDDVNAKNKILKRIKFNLNDRSEMPDKILLGQNFIKAGDFVITSDIDRNVNEEYDELEEFQKLLSEESCDK